MFRFIPWLIGVIVLALAIAGWLESQDRGTLGRFVDRVRYGDEGPVERAGRQIDEKIDEKIEEAVKELQKD